MIRTRTTILYGLLFVLLFLGFYRNQWNVAETSWFYKHQLYAEALVMGRLVKAERDGFFSAGMLPGWIGPVPRDQEEKYWQYTVYEKGLPFETYLPYRSHPSLHTTGAMIVDALSPFSNERNVSLFHAINSATFALSLVVFVVLLAGEAGVFGGVLVFLSILLSPWMTVFGKNAWWVMGTWLVPLFVCWALVRGGVPSIRRFAVWIFAAVLFKCLWTGYEFATSLLGMMLVPLIFFAVRDAWGWRPAVRAVVVAMAVSVAAIFVSMGVVVVENAAESGSWATGVDHITSTIGRRAHGEPNSEHHHRTAESMRAGTWETLVPYFGGTAFDLGQTFGPALRWTALPYGALVALAAALTIATLFMKRFRGDRRALAFSAAVWWSFVSAVSWFVIFKAHSYIHTHINYIVWHFPFVMFVFGQLGYLAAGPKRPGRETI